MKKFLTVLLVIAVMFTFSFSSAFAGTFEAKTSDEKTALITVAQTELAASKDYLDTVKAYYLKSFEGLALNGDYAGVTVEKAAIEKIIDDVFADLNKAVTLVYNDVIIDINAGTFDVDGNDNPTLADAKTAVKAIIKDAYTTDYTADKIDGIIKGDADYVEAAAEAQFDVVKADALAKLDKVNFGNYSTTVPDDPTYDGKYYSNQKIAQTIVDNAKDDIAKIKFDKDDAAANIEAINESFKDIVDATVVEDADTEGLYYVLTDGKVAAAALEKDSDLVKRAATEAKEEKTLAEEKAYQISVVNGKISLAEAKIRKELNAKLETKLTKDEKKVYEDALADLTKYLDACKEVAAAQINYAETNDEAKEAGAFWTEECDAILIAGTEKFTKDEVTKYVNFFKSIVEITEKVDAQEALAAKMKGETGFNGTPLYDAADIDDALAEDIEALYTTGRLSENGLSSVVANEDLVKAEMNRVLTGRENVVLDKVVYPVVVEWLDWDGDDYAHDAKIAEADKIIRETVDAIRAAKTVADVDAAFVAGYEKFKAVPTEEDFDKFWDKEETEEALAKYTTKLTAAIVEKVADYGSEKFEKDYDVESAIIDNLVSEYLLDAYTMDELAAGYEKALAEIKNLKTKAELEAEQKAINDAILAIKAPVTAADEETVLALAKRVGDFYDYQTLIGLYANQAYAYTVYDSLLDQYVETLKDLAEEKLEDAYDAIEKGGITVDDEAAIAELEKLLKDYAEKYGEGIDDLIDAYVAGAMADLKVALVEAKADEVEAAIAKIDASAKPLDLAAIKAAREAYDALGEVGIDVAKYHKLLSLENLAKVESISAVESLKLTASSKATKGAITVKWTVKGDKAAADGYQVWKSTKKNSGYKKAFTTSKTTYKNSKGLKKGTRYYYKVRAYVVVDGKTYYSDWSNKAYRVAK